MSIFSKKISESEVIKYLSENPDFFLKNPDSLEDLAIKHESGEAVSLIEKLPSMSPYSIELTL